MVRWNPTPLLIVLLLLAAGCTTPARDPDQTVAVETATAATSSGDARTDRAPTFHAFSVMWTGAPGQEGVATFDRTPLLAVEFEAHRARGDHSYTTMHADRWHDLTRLTDGIDYEPKIRCYRFILEHDAPYQVALCGHNTA